jgi:outer membrane lipoprotein SlyB
MNGKLILALTGAAAALAACASDPYYDSPRYTSAPAPYYARDVAYNDYGRVVAIDVVQGHSNGVAGAVVGGIVGGVVGHQIGSGRGNDVATAAGAVGGAVAGNQIEKHRAGEAYRIVVEFRDGRQATFMQDSLNDIRVGDRVRVDRDRLYRE